MFTENNSKKARRKLEIKELAELATEKINENKILLQTLSIYQQQINIIKQILEKKSKLSNSTNENTNTNLSIKDEFISYYNQLKECVENIKEANKKLKQKYETNNNIIFDESSLTKLDLNKNRIDIFILDYELKQKNDIIKKLNESIINSRRHTIFREIKRESEISRNSGTNYLNTDNLYLQRDLQVECRNYNKCINRYKKKQKKLKTFKETEKYFKDAIKCYEDEKKLINKNKIIKNKIFDSKKNDVKSSNFFSFTVNRKKPSNNKRTNNYINNGANSITIDELGKKYNFEENSLNIIDEEENYNKDQTYFPNNNIFS